MFRCCPLAAWLGRWGSPPRCPRPLTAQPGRAAVFPLPETKASSFPGDLFPSPGSRPGCHQLRSATASCPHSHPGSDSHPGHQPTGSGQPGTELPHSQLPAAPRSDVSFATISFSWSLQPHAGVKPLPSTVPPCSPMQGWAGSLSTPSPPGSHPNSRFPGLRQDPLLPALPCRGHSLSVSGLASLPARSLLASRPQESLCFF